MKRFLIILVALSCLLYDSNAFSQSTDDQIASDINSAQWFSLERHMAEISEDSVSPFMELIGTALTAAKFNRSKKSVASFERLINNHSDRLGLGNLLMMSHLMANDLSKLGRNSEASELITDIVNATSQYLDSVSLGSFNNLAKQYNAFAKYRLNEIILPDNEIPRITFILDSIHTDDSNSCYMKLCNSTLNGIPVEPTFDTGAGINIISDSIAALHGVKNLDVPVSAKGINEQNGWLGMADEITIGNITIRNVPFYVITISSGNEEADKYAGHLDMLLGIQIMQTLKEFTIDYITNEITVAATPASHPEAIPNICYSNSLQLIGNFNSGDIQAIIDTGDAEYCTLNKRYYLQHEKEIKEKGTPDTQRLAGAGGIHESEGYNLHDFPLNLDGCSVILPEVYVSEHIDTECDGLIGIDALCLFKRLHFNMNDMTLTVE